MSTTRKTRKTRWQYNVYHAPDGCALTYLGRVGSLRAARKLAARGGGLPEWMWQTAEAAGHCGGGRAPDRRGEASEPTAWFGRRGEYCAVRVTVPRQDS